MVIQKNEAKSTAATPIGLEAPQFVVHLRNVLRAPGIGSVVAFRFKVYPPTLTLEERIKKAADPSTLEILGRAEELRSHWLALTGRDLPFWDSVSVASFVKGSRDLLIRESARHDSRCAVEEISVANLTLEVLHNMLAAVSDENVVGLYSKCRLQDGSFAHIPMMDFRGTPSEQYLATVKKGLASINQTRGVILESGRSYHFYGFNLLSEEEWPKFMGKCLLLAPLTDSRYIAHRLIEGEAALRLTASTLKPHVPSVIDIL